MSSKQTTEPTYRRIREVFDQVLDAPEAERDRIMDGLGLAEDERRIVMQLLAGHAKRRLFEVPALDWVNQIGEDDPVEPMVGKHIGTCELLRPVGRGGSSIVFLARRRVGETTQDVALKLLDNGILSPEARRRFRREQAILSRLSHPNIARLIDAGIADFGNPYMVMEYVDGEDLVSHASARSLDQRTRIGLLIDLCRAVDAAHRALVVHRDLKPSNVLVTPDGVVKVLDFGIAKLLDDDRPLTATQHVALTPAYAAPEQFAPGPAATSMDVYSLGVLSSELLLQGRLGPDATLGAHESADTRQRWRRIDNDLSQILRAALASEPARRYSSAGHMADDFQRYLHREPLAIMPVSRWYRTRKFVSRHRTAVTAASLIFMAILAGTIGIAYQWRIAQQQAVLARKQAAIAHEEAVRAQSIRDFLISLFDAGKAEIALDRKPNIDDIVADAGQRLLVDDKLDAPLRTDLLLTLSNVANSIGAYDRSDRLLDEVDRMLPGLDRGAADATLQARVQRAENLMDQSTTKGARVLALLDPLLPALEARDDETGFRGLAARVRALQITGRQADADEALRKLVDRFRTAPSPALALAAMSMQIKIAVEAQHYPEAIGYIGPALDFWNAHDRPQTPLMMSTWTDIAIAREGIGDIAGAEEAYRNAISMGDRLYARPTVDQAQKIQIYGTFLLAQSRLDEAETQIRRALQIQQSVFGEEDPRTAQAVYAMARLYGARRNFSEAIRWLDKAISFYRRDGRSTMLARSLAARGRFHAQSGEFDAADGDLREALATQRALSGETKPGYAWILDVLADVQLREHHYEDALRTTEQALAITAPVGGAMLQMTLSMRLKRAKALFALERAAEALVEIDDIEPAYARIAPKSGLRFDIAALKAIALARTSREADAHDAAVTALGLLPLTQEADPSMLGLVRALASGGLHDSAH